MAGTMSNIPLAEKDVLGGPGALQVILDDQHNVKNGKVAKASDVKNPSNAAMEFGSKIAKKKGVNNFLLFRSKFIMFQNLCTAGSCALGMAMMLFHNLPQAERSPIIRAMWDQERHKPSWSLMARVWTFIRDNSEYKNIFQYLCCAIDLIRTVPPEAWLATYKMVLVEANGSQTLRQYANPGFIRAPRDLSDFELLKGVVMRGLAVNDPEGLLRKMLQNSNHLMTATKMGVDDPAKADEAFFNAMNYDSINTVADLLGLPAADNSLDFGINVIDVADVTNFDDSLVTSTGGHTHLRFHFDTSTTHLARPQSGSLDLVSQETNNIFDMQIPHQWEQYGGQMSQDEYESCMFPHFVVGSPC